MSKDDTTPEVAVQPSLPTLELEEFEGRKPVGVITRVNGAGSRIHRAMHYDERVILVVEGEIANVAHGKTADGMKRIQTVGVLDLYELEGKAGAALLRSLRQAHKIADDARTGKKGLPLSELEQPDANDDGLEVTVDASGNVLTSSEAAEARGEILPGLPHVDVAVLVFGDGSRALWPDDFANAVGPHPEAGERIAKPGAKAKDDDELVVKVLDADTGEELEEWTNEQEDARLAELEEAAVAAETVKVVVLHYPEGDWEELSPTTKTAPYTADDRLLRAEKVVAVFEDGHEETVKERLEGPALPGEDDDPADVAAMNLKRLEASRIMANPDGPGVRAAGSIKADLPGITDLELVREIRRLEELGGARKTLLDAASKRIAELEKEPSE